MITMPQHYKRRDGQTDNLPWQYRAVKTDYTAALRFSNAAWSRTEVRTFLEPRVSYMLMSTGSLPRNALSAKRGLAIACRPSVCDVGGLW